MTELEFKINKAKVELKEKIIKLTSDPLWQEIIEVEYFQHEAIRLVNSIGNLQLTREHKDNLLGMMNGIPALHNFLGRIIGDGYQAESDLENIALDNEVDE